MFSEMPQDGCPFARRWNLPMGMIVLPRIFALAMFAVSGLAGATSPRPGVQLESRIRPDICRGKYWEVNPVKWVDANLFFRRLDRAIEAAASIDEARFTVEVMRAARGDYWMVYIRYRELPSAAELSKDEAELATLAGRLAGELWRPGCTGFPFWK